MLEGEEAERDASFCHPEGFGPKDLRDRIDGRSFADAQDDNRGWEEDR